ncbi:hypothetical protein [Amycolatopsis jiangsuensis]|uniref:Zn-dependent alcohol dehydrogenase n=1 Tax=Amycolatopsis jiangsuensis TaxID=1181879 RepID=A0A840J8G8_9PSEU|nr:hypothetical protein [Amycolatopsis jiangsuensis]MBB4689678.1 Zn-dependent alcohol dehydrogenase [Amycolatopsis jiangsuensis]
MLDLYRRGESKLDELVTRQYRRDAVAQAFRDQSAGELVVGVVLFD